MSTHPAGTTGTINEGSFSGFSATVIEHKERLRVTVEIFGRRTEIEIDPVQFDADFDGTDPTANLLMQFEKAHESPYHVRCAFWWARAAREESGEEEPQQLFARFEVFQGELQREREGLRQRFETWLAEHPPEARAAALRANRDRWIVPPGGIKVVYQQELQKLMKDGLVPELREEGLSEQELAERERALHDAGRKLRRDTERFIRKARRALEPIGARDVRTDPVAHHEPLEQAIEGDLAGSEPYLVYADFLQSKADPRGELMTAQLTGATEIAAAILRHHEIYFLGGLRNYLGPLAVQWHGGFISEARIALTHDDFEDDIDVPLILSALLELPSARFLRTLVLGIFDNRRGNHYDPFIRVLLERPQPTLQNLFIGDTRADEQEISWTSAGDLTEPHDALPNLRSLRVHAGRMELGSLAFPALRSLRIETGGLTLENVRSLDAGTWPELEELRIWFGQEQYGAEGGVEEIARILSGEGLPKLRQLGLQNASFTDELASRVIGAPVLSRLEELDLSMGTLTDAGAESLVAGAMRLRYLKRLNVSANYLSKEGLARLATIGPEVVSTHQNVAFYGHDGQLPRYPSVGE